MNIELLIKMYMKLLTKHVCETNDKKKIIMQLLTGKMCMKLLVKAKNIHEIVNEAYFCQKELNFLILLLILTTKPVRFEIKNLARCNNNILSDGAI